jgi:bifunctional DNase/RNase
MSDMIEVVIDSIRVSLMSQQRIVILREVQAERYLPIWIGVYEAEAITLSLQEVEVARPLTWDLLKNIFSIMNAHIVRVEVVALKDDTFYGNIVAEVNNQMINIDSRPSDALALAVRANVPVLVERSIMDTAGITPEDDLQGKGEAKGDQVEKHNEEPELEGGEESLSVFEDFFDKMNLDDLDKDEGEEGDKGKEKD